MSVTIMNTTYLHRYVRKNINNSNNINKNNSSKNKAIIHHPTRTQT